MSADEDLGKSIGIIGRTFAHSLLWKSILRIEKISVVITGNCMTDRKSSKTFLQYFIVTNFL